MMKKSGFTLAEVLITLTIIGVVAVLTLPALMANTQEQQARTALRKMVNTASMAASLNASMAGYDYYSITQASPAGGNAQPPEGSLTWLFQERTAHQARSWALPAPYTSNPGVDTAVHFKDGTAVYFSSNELSTSAHARTPGDDGQLFGIAAVFDTNGAKGPNLLSNCVAGALVTTWAGDNNGNCTQKQNRFIKDQFRMRLYGNFAGPVGAASTWMLDDNRFQAGTADRY